MTAGSQHASQEPVSALQRHGPALLAALLLAPAAAVAGTARSNAAGTGAMRAVPLQPAAIIEEAEEGIALSQHGRGLPPVDENPWHICIGHRRVGHYDFAKRMAALTRSEVGVEIRTAYEPARPRNRLLMVTGYVAGSAAVGVGSLMGAVSGALAHRSCDSASNAYDASGCAIRSGARTAGLAVGGIGLAVLVLTGVYQAATTEPLADTSPYYTKSEAERLVEQYNRLVFERRQGDGDRDRAPTAAGEQTSRSQHAPPGLLWALRLYPAGATLVARF